MEYYGLDIHKLSITYTCMNEQGKILRRGRVDTTPEAIRGIVAPSGDEAWVALEATRGWSYVYDALEGLSAGLEWDTSASAPWRARLKPQSSEW